MSVDRSILAKIHIAKKELGLSDDEYRGILQDRYKKDTAAKLTRFEAEDLVEHFKKLGFKVKRPAASSGQGGDQTSTTGDHKTSPNYEKPMARKVVAIWITLALAGAVRNGSDAALQSYVKRMTGVDNLAWCDDQQLWRLIEALKKWAKREKVELDD